MPLLLFKKEFFDAIRRGTKTTTLRRWKSCSISAGDRVKAPGVGWLKIRTCEPVKLKQLKAADAKADGFESLAALHAALDRFYPDQRGDGKAWYRIAFDFEEATTQIGGSAKGKREMAGVPKGARDRLARRIRAELDKAVQRSRSLPHL